MGITPQHVMEHRVVYSDIDFNRHVNTMRYINMMFDMLPIEQLTAIRPVRLDIHFMHECRYGQTLTVGYEQQGRLVAVRGFERRGSRCPGGARVALRCCISWWRARQGADPNRLRFGPILRSALFLSGTGFADIGTKPLLLWKKIKVANKYQKSIDLLNDALGKEIATSLQYMYFHVHFEDAGYEYLSKKMRMISIAEMRHSEELSDRILFLQGDVNMNPSFPTRQITDPKEMFRFAMQLEQSTIDSYNDAARIAAEADDSVTHKMFQDLAVEEEEHLDYFRNELQNLLDYGDKEYLALQSFARSKAEAEGKVSE